MIYAFFRPVLIILCFVHPAAAGQTDVPSGEPARPSVPPPAPPAVQDEPPVLAERDTPGPSTIRAVRLTAPLRIDGRLDESHYSYARPVSDFIQTEPRAGLAATERTEIWVSFDDRNVYVSARCWESEPERVLVNEMRRDSTNVGQNDNLAWTFDTFLDRRNGIMFEINPIGGRMDGQSTNDESTNFDWNPIWDVKAGRFEGGWTVEAAIPFKSLRYRAGQAQVWGFNVRRRNRWKNEVSYLSPIPATWGMRGLRPSLAGTLVGIEAPPTSRNLEVKPFVTSSLTTDAVTQPRISNDPRGDVGVDLKYGLSRSMTADLTYNTDFAQVEADEQQVNLSRFNLQFPEKREFFLENRATFSFGGESSDTPVLFYSRRIGLNEGRLVPIRAGGRVTGRLGKFSLGGLNIQADKEPTSGLRSTNFSVVRLKRDILQQSSVGVILTDRSIGPRGTGRNTAYGVDGAFRFFGSRLSVNTYWAQTRTDSLSGDDTSYRAQLEYGGDRYGVELERLAIGDNFNPEVGFVRRDDMRRSFGLFRFSPRPKRSKLVRKLNWTGFMTHVENGRGILESREVNGEFSIEFQNSDRFIVGITDSYEYLPRPFSIPLAPRVVLPVGGYDFTNTRVGYNFGQQHVLSANLLAEYGSFYNGRRVAFSASQGNMRIHPQLSVQPTYSLNHAELTEGTFTTHLAGSRVTFTVTPQMFVSALVQYNSTSRSAAANVRLRWEYRPGSELFVVLNEQRGTALTRFPALANRSLIVKMNRLLRF